jgi:hypothetical protein
MNASKPKVQKESRTSVLRVRFKPSELSEAKRLAEGRSLSAIVRASLLGLPEPKVRPGPKPAAPMTAYDRAKIAQLAWFGNNLNQLARAANSKQQDGTLLLLALLRLERTMKEAANAH